MKTVLSMPYHYDQLASVAQELHALSDQCAIYAFSGDLGSGKTTLIREALAKFGVYEFAGSPTFGYLTVYKTAKKHQIFHFDLYRLSTLEEFVSLGFTDYIDQAMHSYERHARERSWVFIEWPALVMPLLNKHACIVEQSHQDDETVRFITVKLIA